MYTLRLRSPNKYCSSKNVKKQYEPTNRDTHIFYTTYRYNVPTYNMYAESFSEFLSYRINGGTQQLSICLLLHNKY